jgi:antitoxin ChpS
LEKLAGETPVSRFSKGRYSLSDLMAQCDLNAPLSAEDRTWLDAPAIGREA